MFFSSQSASIVTFALLIFDQARNALMLPDQAKVILVHSMLRGSQIYNWGAYSRDFGSCL